MKQSLHQSAARMLDFLFPPLCALCRDSLDATTASSPVLLCDSCRESLPVSTGILCSACGAPVGPYAPSRKCHHCRNDRFAFSGAVTLGVYGGTLRDACLMGKSPDGIPALAALTRLLLQVRGDALRDFRPDWIVPVPEHWRKRWRRPHNPAEAVARVLARELRVPVGHRLLAKHRHTPSQVTLPATGRRTNLRGAFRAAVPSAVRGTRVLLVDDVMTTGATVQACSRALKAAGADEIFVAALARGLG